MRGPCPLQPTTQKVGAEKLRPNWEGSYIIVRSLNYEADHLEDLKDNRLQRHWNTTNLKRYYV